MKKGFLTISMALLALTASAQQTGSDYIVKTKGAVKSQGDGTPDGDSVQSEKKAHDFISENFKFYSLCEWPEGLKFMVMPEKYDMVVKTFHDAATGKEVSSMPLRHKIMIYKGHSEGSDGRAHVNFLCQDNDKMYYYEVPNGTFDDYCYGKMGVPTLAYLGDVDIAREKLIGKHLFTKAKKYRIDTDYDSDGFQEIDVDENLEVTVTKVGVGSRSFPVKIIVEDETGREFYQNVAISKTNSGMRDDEFIMDNAKFVFAGSFELQDALMDVSKDLAQYIGKDVYTRYATDMISRGDGKDRKLKVPRLTSFTIENVQPKNNSPYVTLTLKELESRRIYFKEVTFKNVDNVTGDIDGRREDYFGYLFAMGVGKVSQMSQAVRTAVRQGRVILRMTEDEVVMAMGGEPIAKENREDGRYSWSYQRSKGLFTVIFGRDGRVERYITPGQQKSQKRPVSRKPATKRKK